MNALDEATILMLSNESISKADKSRIIQELRLWANRPDWLKKHIKGRSDKIRWAAFRSEIGESRRVKYRHSHNQLISVAEYRAEIEQNNGIKRNNRVTSFSSWVHNLYLHSKGSGALAEHHKAERKIALLIAGTPQKSGWEVIYEDDFTSHKPAITISNLLIQGQPMRGKPDVVFREIDTGNIVIVERKVSNKAIPSDGWPDLRAQLWSYSQADDWRDAPNLLLVGEIWGFNMNNSCLPFRRGCVRWNSNDSEFNIFNKNNKELFDLYSYKN